MELYKRFKQFKTSKKSLENVAVGGSSNNSIDSFSQPKPVLKDTASHMRKIVDTASLKVRLTIGIAGVAALGMGSLAVWTGVKMQHILVSTHKENIKYIAERFPMDVEVYSEMIPLEEGRKERSHLYQLPIN